MKTKPFAYQQEAVEAGRNLPFFADFSEQGTGKTWMCLAEVEWWFQQRVIDRLIIIAPPNVHDNWIEIEIPTHVSTPWIGLSWVSGSPRVKREITKLSDPLHQPSRLKIVAFNYEAFASQSTAFFTAQAFIQGGPAAIAIDESHYIANPNVKRTDNIILLARQCVRRRIMSGTPLSKNPAGLWSQFQCLGDDALPYSSYWAMLRRYAQLLPSTHPKVQNLMARTGARRPPMIIETDGEGQKIFKRLDELNRVVGARSRRFRKADKLDLPPKVYVRQYFNLSKLQRDAYTAVKRMQQIPDRDFELILEPAVVITMKLRQITSGFIIDANGVIQAIDMSARMAALRPIIDGLSGPVIIWAHFNEEIRALQAFLTELGLRSAMFYGATPKAERSAIRDQFQAGKLDAFIGNPAAAAEGITLTAANVVVYYSNNFSPIRRSQSEDRAHRIGQLKSVTYYDILARDTIDDRILAVLRSDLALSYNVLDAEWELPSRSRPTR